MDNIWSKSILLSRNCFMDYLKMKWMKLLTHFRLSTLPLIIRIPPLPVMNLLVSAKIFDMETVTYDIKSIIHHEQRWLAMLNVESHPKYLLLVYNTIVGEMLRKLNLENYQLSVVIYHRNKVLYILQPVLNQSGIQTVICIIFKVRIIQGMYGIMTVIYLTNS